MKKLLFPLLALLFTMTATANRAGTNSYWTADGQVWPLDYEIYDADPDVDPDEESTGIDTRLLRIPKEAVAVDLRGLHTLSTTFSVDASQANPNCIYYLDSLDQVPQGLDNSRNIVRGLEAETIRITEGNDYLCPLAFHTQFVSYMMTPAVKPNNEANGYSETIVLPFRPTHISLYDINGDTEMLHSDMLSILRYYGTDADTLIVGPCKIEDMEAYAPYILGVYIDSKLLFMGEDIDVPMTQEAIVRSQHFYFVGTTVSRRLASTCYVFDPVTNTFYQSSGSDKVAPFRAYLDAVNYTDCGQLWITDNSWGPKGNPNGMSATHVLPAVEKQGETRDVYDLKGRQVSRKTDSQHLPKGIYITGGRKVIVK